MNANPHDILAQIGRLLIEAQIARMKNTVVSVIVSQDQAEATVEERQPLKASKVNFSQYEQK